MGAMTREQIHAKVVEVMSSMDGMSFPDTATTLLSSMLTLVISASIALTPEEYEDFRVALTDGISKLIDVAHSETPTFAATTMNLMDNDETAAAKVVSMKTGKTRH